MKKRILLAMGGILWVALISAGLATLYNYQFKAGPEGIYGNPLAIPEPDPPG